VKSFPIVAARRFAAIVAVAIAVAACGTGSPAASTAPSLPPADAAGFTAATCTAIDELFLAWGNPDTAEKSDAWTSFEAAIERRDTALLDSASGEILTHIAAARAATAHGATWPPGAEANAEMDAVLAGLEAQVTTVRAARGDATAAAQAADTMQTTNWPRLLVYFEKLRQLLETKAIQLPSLPCKA
jgi:hypothetical protein